MKKFGSYFYKETCKTDIPIDDIEWIGQSLQWYNHIRGIVENAIGNSIPLHKVDIKEYLSVHSEVYINSIIENYKNHNSNNIFESEINVSLECLNLEHNLEGFEYSLGGMYKAIELMKEGFLDRAYCFQMGGHHSYSDHGHGYCLLNAPAAGIKYAQSQGYNKVLLVDWDHHHGDGTQSIFENDKTVKIIDIHSGVDNYMVMQRVIREGTTTYGEKVGHINIPVLTKEWTKEEYLNKLKLEGEIYKPEDVYDKFKKSLNSDFVPDMIMIFDGHDSSEQDCGSEAANWSDEDFEKYSKLVIDKSIEWNCPVLSMMGGGYHYHSAQLAIQHANILKNYRI